MCRSDLFTAMDKLQEKYSEEEIARIMRIRDEYNWFLSNPEAKDRQFIEQAAQRNGIKKHEAWRDLGVVKSLLPHLGEASRDFHRFRYNEMILETFQMAKKRKDTKTMERAASSYAKYNRIDMETEQQLPFELIVVQPFTATDDPSVLGIKPIPDLQKKINGMIEKYRAENIDIDDIEYEEADTEENDIFALPENGTEEDIL